MKIPLLGILTSNLRQKMFQINAHSPALIINENMKLEISLFTFIIPRSSEENYIILAQWDLFKTDYKLKLLTLYKNL